MCVWIWKHSQSKRVLCVCVGQSAPLDWFNACHPPLFSEEDFPHCCQAFLKVLIIPILGYCICRGISSWPIWPFANRFVSAALSQEKLGLSCSCFIFSRGILARIGVWFSFLNSHGILPFNYERPMGFKHLGIGPWPRSMQTDCCYSFDRGASAP